MTTTARIRDLADTLLAMREDEGMVYLYPHRGVDGDALGSCLSLLLLLHKVGIPARFLLEETIPAKYDFLPAMQSIELYLPQEESVHASKQSLAVAVDCSSGSRMGQRQSLFDRAGRKAVIDHHVPEGENGKLEVVDPTAAATGELIFLLIRQLEAVLDKPLLDQDMATLLMTALITDTGRFSFSNTTKQTFSIAAQLMRFPIELRDLVHRLYDLTSAARLRLTGKIFSQMRFFHDGRIVLACVEQALMQRYEADDSDLDGLAGQLRNIEGVEVSFLLRELESGAVRVNIRSGPDFDSAVFARLFGGGGHARAAGATLENDALQDAANRLVAKAGEWLS